MADDQTIQALQNLSLQLGQVTKALATVLPAVQSTATSSALPATPTGYLNITLPNGTAAKVPYY